MVLLGLFLYLVQGETAMSRDTINPAVLIRRVMKTPASGNIPFGSSLLRLRDTARQRELERSLQAWEPLLYRNKLSSELSRKNELRLHALANAGLTVFKVLIGILAAAEIAFFAILLFHLLV
jgi:hypothetical protein